MLVRLVCVLALIAVVQGACSDNFECGPCIANPVCGWCADLADSDLPGCLEGAGTARTIPTGCASGWYYPSSREVSSNRNSPPLSDTVPVTPTSVEILLRPLVPLDVPIAVRNIAPDLDLYLIQDLSGSFSNDLSEMKRNRNSLVGDVNGATCNRPNCVRFGVGGYIDKPTSPYGSTSYGDYVFGHQLSLTASATAAANAINALSTRSGSDGPEAQIDGLMQTISCPEVVGWDDSAGSTRRRMVFLTTDNTYHYRGEGPAYRGISSDTDYSVQNNGEDCRTDSEEDFPSLPQIKKTLIKYNVVPIFAVTPNYLSHYSALIDYFGFGASAELEYDSGNLIDAIGNGYAGASAIVRMAVSTDAYRHVTSISPAAGYTGAAIGDEYTFSVTFLYDPVISPTVSDNTIKLAVLGLSFVDVDVTYLTNCGCEDGGPATFGVVTGVAFDCPGTPDCSGHGTCVCGVCECDDAYSGESCDCEDDEICIESDTCHGHGTCSCGTCTCFPGYSSSVPADPTTACDCSSLPCPSATEDPCSGHGTCSCEKCTCDAGWEGNAECSCSTAPCPVDADGVECSGIGVCDCGTCKCPVFYIGDACECNSRPCPGNCHGHGTCTCGECTCDPGYTTESNCRCSTAPCPTDSDGATCSGHGSCICGECKCDAGWEGDLCDCVSRPCAADSDGRVCAGNGNCTCGECECFPGFVRNPYTLNESVVDCDCEFQKECDPPCANGVCNDCGECVCETGWSGAACDSCNLNCAIIDPCDAFPNCEECTKNGCMFCSQSGICSAKQENGKGGCPEDPARAEDQCPEAPLLTKEEIIGTAVGVSLALFFFFIAAVLLFRLLTYLKDKREFAAFENEKKNSKWRNDDNPIFKKEEKTGANPLYNNA